MSMFSNLMADINEYAVADRVEQHHNRARMAYGRAPYTVTSFEQFEEIIGDYYNYHFSQCIANGGYLSRAQAAGKAKEVLERAYRKYNGDVNTAYSEASTGLNGGMGRILDMIAEALREEGVRLYLLAAFDHHVKPVDWPGKVQVIRELFRETPLRDSPAVDPNTPERYAHDYRPIVQAYAEAQKRISEPFRRL